MQQVYVLITETYRNGERTEHNITVFREKKFCYDEWRLRSNQSVTNGVKQFGSSVLSLEEDKGEFVFDLHIKGRRKEWCDMHWIERHAIHGLDEN